MALLSFRDAETAIASVRLLRAAGINAKDPTPPIILSFWHVEIPDAETERARGIVTVAGHSREPPVGQVAVNSQAGE